MIFSIQVPLKPIKKLFWNAHQNFDAPLIEIPQSGIKRINILYNKNVPEFVDSSSTYNGISENRTIWVNYGFMHALNVEGKVFVEYMFLKKFRTNSDHIIIKNLSILEDVKNSEEPAIFVSGHFANFELMSMEITKKKLN